jgi:hypothetical protein
MTETHSVGRYARLSRETIANTVPVAFHQSGL